MATVIGKQELCRIDNFERYFKAIQGMEGRTLFSRYAFLANIISANIDSNYQDFLAHPVLDKGDIAFYGPSYKEMPRLLSELYGDDATNYRAITDQTVAHYQGKITALRNAGKIAEAQYIAGAIKFILSRMK